MGGNVELNGFSADKIDLNEVGRVDVCAALYGFLVKLDTDYFVTTGEDLFDGRQCCLNREIMPVLSGSSSFLFDKTITTGSLVHYKPVLGDVDVQIDREKKGSLRKYLDSLPASHVIGEFQFIGYKETTQFITLWKWPAKNKNIQIDLELVDYEFFDPHYDFSKGPSTWARFSHSTDWRDTCNGIKGVFHKYLLRALTNKEKSVYKDHKGKEYHTSWYAFSVDYGLRQRYDWIHDTGMVYVYTPSEAPRTTDLKRMFRVLLNKKNPTPAQMRKFWSFCGIVEMAPQYLNEAERLAVVTDFYRIIWGNGSQRVSKDPAEDFKLKDVAFSYLLRHWNLEEQFKDVKRGY